MIFNEDEKQIANDLFDKAKSHLEAPLIGCVFTPICKSCKNSDYHYGTWIEPECKVYKKIPDEYRLAKTKSCPHYAHDPDSKHIPYTEEDTH